MLTQPQRAGKPPFSNAREILRSGIPIYSGTRVIGVVAGRTFRKPVKASKHMLQRPRGWAVDVAALKDALAVAATHVEIVDTETGAIYRASIRTILDQGRQFDRGYGRQVVLPLDAWERPDLGGTQLDMFGGAAS